MYAYDPESYGVHDRTMPPEDPQPRIAPPDGPPPKKKWKGWAICVCCSIVFFVVALAIILPILFLIQRRVDFDILPIYVDNQTINIDPSGFTIPVNPTVHTVNENFFDIGISSLQVQGSHPLYGNGQLPLGTGFIQEITLWKRSEMNFTFPFVVVYNRTIDPDFTYFSALLTNCTMAGNANLYIGTNVEVNYHMWAKSDTIHDARNVMVPCPVTPERATEILAIVNSMKAAPAVPAPAGLPAVPSPSA